MRSQIACSKCRSSKVRCVNQGPGTQCDACASKGRTCSYPAPNLNGAGSGNPKRRENSLAATQDGPNGRSGEASVKKRKIAPLSTALKDGLSGTWDLFNPQLFTRQTWHELFAIFEQHFATDLPFLHAETFINQLRRVDVRSPVDPFASLLYAFLALTTPFHDSFVRHPWHGQARPSTPVEISEKYAGAARARLNSSNAYRKPNIETTQALLMLGLHEWRNRQGAQCFLTIGSAINCAEMLGCHEQHDLDEGDTLQPPQKPMAKPPGIKLPEDEPSLEDQLIAAEIKRRTYWCCFILDSYVSSGERRRQKVRIDEIKIQLPCNQRAFDLGLNVRTMMLDETPSQFENRRLEYERSDRTDSDMEVEWQFEKDQEALAWFIKALVVYRGVMDWVCNTTRRKAKKWPWDPESQFYQLKERLDSLKQNLHSDLRLTDKRTKYHIRNRTSRSYVQLHSILALCDMALHREYIAYLPWDQKIPAGPVDGPMPPKLPKGKEKYWEDNARSCFKAAKTFNDLIWTCKEEGALVETPVVGFAMFYVMQIVIWCRFFPSQDQGDWLCTIGTRHDRKLSENLDKAFSILFHMHERLPMARMWCRDSKDYVDDLERLRKERHGTGESPVSNNSNSTEGSNTGLSHWERIEKRLKEFFRTKDDDLDADDNSVTDLRHMDHTSEPNSPHPVKSEHEDAVDTPLSASRAPASFVAINGNGPQNGGTPKAMDRQTSTPAPGQYPQPYQNGSYGPEFGLSPKGAQVFPPPTAYHPIESKERDTLNHTVYKYPLAAHVPPPISQYTAEEVHPQPCHDYGTRVVDWHNDYYMVSFAAGNDENNVGLPWNASQGFHDNYVNAGNNPVP